MPVPHFHFHLPASLKKWAPCALEEAKEAPGGLLPLENNVMQDSLGWQSGR